MALVAFSVLIGGMLRKLDVLSVSRSLARRHADINVTLPRLGNAVKEERQSLVVVLSHGASSQNKHDKIPEGRAWKTQCAYWAVFFCFFRP